MIRQGGELAEPGQGLAPGRHEPGKLLAPLGAGPVRGAVRLTERLVQEVQDPAFQPADFPVSHQGSLT